MNTKFESDYNLIEFRDKLQDLIENKRKDNFLSHFRNVISWRSDSISGKIDKNEFVIWQYEYRWSSLFYSVINGKIKDNGNSLIIELKSKLNIVGLLLSITISLFVGYGLLIGMDMLNASTFVFLIRRLLLGFLLLMIFQVVPFFAYMDSKRRTMKILIDALKLNKNVC